MVYTELSLVVATPHKPSNLTLSFVCKKVHAHGVRVRLTRGS